MAENEREITTVFRADISNFTAATQQLNRDIALVNSEFKNATASMGRWSDSTEGLNAKLKQLGGVLNAEKKRLSLLEAQYDELKAAGKENTAEAQRLATAINNQSAKVKATQKQIDDYTNKLDDLKNSSNNAKKSVDDLTNSAEKQGTTFKSIASSLGSGLVKGIAGVGVAAAGAVTGFLALGESTRETRKLMGQLETSFATAGFSAETAQKAYADFNSVLGDTGKSTETLQHLAMFAKTEDELANYTDILTGVYAKFGESIPTEGLAEGINHTIQLGEVQGTLADALEWGGVNLEDFNAKLATLDSEQERSAYIQKTLNGLYGEAATQYKEVNKDIIEAEKAQTNLTTAMANLGKIAEPIMTMLKQATADLLTELEPFIKLMGEGLQGVFNGTEGAAEKFAEGISGLVTTALTMVQEAIPKVLSLVTALLPSLLETIISSTPTIIQTLASGFVQIINALASMLPTILPLIVQTVLDCAETILNNLDVIINAGIELVVALADGLIKALPILIDKLPILIDKVVQAITNNLPKLIKAGGELTIKLAQGLLDAVPKLITKLPEIITSIVNGLLKGIPDLIKAGGELLAGLFEGLLNPSVIWENIKSLGKSILDGFKSFFGIASPSKVMRKQIGLNLGEGLGEGLLDSEKDVQKDIAKFNKGVLSSFKYSLNPNISMPALATGGIVTSPTLAMVGEAGKEAVLPLENNTAWLDALADKLANKMGRNTVNNFNYTFERMETTKLALHKAQLETKRIIGG